MIPANRITSITDHAATNCHVVTSSQPHGDRTVKLSFRYPRDDVDGFATALSAHHSSMDHLQEMSIEDIARTLPYALVPLPAAATMTLGDLGINEDGSVKEPAGA